jgi:hypothetical protein
VSSYFHDFKRASGEIVVVEYEISPGESDFDYPGHICDGGGSGPDVSIVSAHRLEGGGTVYLLSSDALPVRILRHLLRPSSLFRPILLRWWLADDEGDQACEEIAAHHVFDDYYDCDD